MRAYHFTSNKHALDDLTNNRMKVATIRELNDPFELLGMNLQNKEDRSTFQSWRNYLAEKFGFLTFSRNWHNNLMWSHYADKHKGVCLGFDLVDENIGNVIYTSTRVKIDLRNLKRDEPSLQSVLQVLSGKFTDWAYEDEVRVIYNLGEPDPRTGLFYAPFGKSLRLREIIAGPLCNTTEKEFRTIVPDTSVKLIKARLAFKSYRVVKNKQGFKT